jgi:hypothetical protein
VIFEVVVKKYLNHLATFTKVEVKICKTLGMSISVEKAEVVAIYRVCVADLD